MKWIIPITLIAVAVGIYFMSVDSNSILSDKKTFITDGVKHSVPLDEIISGGPPKDGIPSIDNPKFLSIEEADGFLNNEETGTGLCVGNDPSTGSGQDCRFYPYQILVWHEIVNDTVGSQPVLITHCPLCLTGIVFERKLEGQTVEFGTSGKLWKSNLVMYNRTDDPKNESLWSQVLGEAIVGEFTGTKLRILPSDIIRYKDWKKLHPNTKVLSKDTGIIRNYGYDPYGDYYTSNNVSFGASFNDNRLHPKEFILGIQVKGKYKAYHSSAITIGETKDIFNGEQIFIQKKIEGEVRMFIGAKREPLPYIGGFWFSWLAVHPETELFK
ncbi:MAG: DUF3179 domain-containing protein [Patescibacteria group bacterium]